MTSSGSGYVALAHTLHALQTEINAHTFADVPSPSLSACKRLCTDTDSGESGGISLAYEVFNSANSIMGDPRPYDRMPRFPLVRAAIAAAAIRGLPMHTNSVKRRACFQAELRLVRSLASHNKGPQLSETNQATPPHRPAAVLFAQDGDPFAYVKSSGYETAFAWRPAKIKTHNGLRFIPANCFFELYYPNASTEHPLLPHYDAGLVSM